MTVRGWLTRLQANLVSIVAGEGELLADPGIETDPNPLTLDSDRLVLRAALEGAGLAYVSEWSAQKALAEGRLIQVLSDWTPPYPGLCLYYPSHRHLAAAMRAFTDVIRELAAGDRVRHTP
jgi:DNA-binding transcriptional LysR family regulator